MEFLNTAASTGTNNTTKSAIIDDYVADYTVQYEKPASATVESTGFGCVTVNGKYYWFKVKGTSNKLGSTIQWCKKADAESVAFTSIATVKAYTSTDWE